MNLRAPHASCLDDGARHRLLEVLQCVAVEGLVDHAVIHGRMAHQPFRLFQVLKNQWQSKLIHDFLRRLSL